MRWLNWIVALPFLLLAVSFIASNRQKVNLNIWPLPFEITLPVSVMGALLFLTGFLIGGFLVWLGGMPSRRQARYLARKLRDQKANKETAQAKLTPNLHPAVHAGQKANQDETLQSHAKKSLSIPSSSV